MKMRMFALGLFCATSLTACKCRVDVHVRGSTRGPVTFYLDSRGIDFVRVAERDFSGGWDEIWEIRGVAGEREIVYGMAPGGFTTGVGPRPLRPHGIYDMEITCEKSLLGPTCSGGLMFTFTPGGEVKVCASVDACRAITDG